MYISYKELAVEQKLNLDYKIESAIKAIKAGFEVCKHRPAIAFSGGKDSTVLWHLIKTHFPKQSKNIVIIYGNTGVEYPECLSFARKLGKEWGGDNFHETIPLKTETEGLKYSAQVEVLKYIVESDRLGEILKDDGKLKSTDILLAICPPELMNKFKEQNLIWKAGTRKSYWWCIDQYGYPLMGKAASKLKAHRINIDCFLKYSQSISEDEKLLAYYELLKEVKISQACCDILKKEPSERLQAELDVDVIFKGLMASESRSRQTNFISRGYLFESSRPHLGNDSFYHCNPISIWNDIDIWEYINKYNIPYSKLYNMGWTDNNGTFHKIKRNGCMGCGTDILYPNNHMAMLRRTHPKQWRVFMEKGMAAEIRKLQQAKRNGQITLFDVYETNDLLDMRPCIFDQIEKFVMFDNTLSEMMDFDSELDV